MAKKTVRELLAGRTAQIDRAVSGAEIGVLPASGGRREFLLRGGERKKKNPFRKTDAELRAYYGSRHP